MSWLFNSWSLFHFFSPPLLTALSLRCYMKELQNMAASYHHTKEALSLPECCLHPSHLHSQLGSLMSEYDKWIEDVSTVDFTVTSDTDKCRHYACYVDYKECVQSLHIRCAGVQWEGWGTGGICPSPCYILVCICICVSHGRKNAIPCALLQSSPSFHLQEQSSSALHGQSVTTTTVCHVTCH